MKIRDDEAAVDKEWEKLRKLTASQMTKVKRKERSSKRLKKKQRTVHFCYNGHISSLK